jgi:hypothetical protein
MPLSRGIFAIYGQIFLIDGTSVVPPRTPPSG